MRFPASLPVFFASTFFLQFFLENIAAQPGARAEKPFTVSAGLRGEYDDNIFTANNNRQSSWKTIVDPSVLYELKLDQTTFSARYTFSATYFTDRPGDDFDLGHDFLARVTHQFTPKFDVDFQNRLNYAQESQIGAGAVVQRRLGDRFQNELSLSGTYKWTERFSTVNTYQNNWVHYEGRALGRVNNYMEHVASQDLRFAVLPTTTAVGTFTFNAVDYETIRRDQQAYIFTVGADHYLTPVWLLSGRVGVQYRTYDNSIFSDQTSPYASLDSIWNYSNRSSVRLGYLHNTSLTDNPGFSSIDTDQISAGITHYLTPKFFVGGSIIYVIGRYEGNESFIANQGNANEDTAYFQLTAGYEFSNYLSALAGYRHTMVSSDFAGRDYDRNQVWFGIRGTY